MGQVGAGPAQQDGGCFLACRVGPKLMKSCVRCISFRQAAGGGGRAAVAAAAAATAACPPAPPTPASALLVRGNHPHGSDCTHLPPAGSAARHAAPGRPCPAHPRLRRAAASRASLGAGGGRQPARCTGMGVDRDCLETIRSHCAGSFGIVSRYCPGLGVHSTCRELPTTCALPGMQLWRCRPTLPPCHNAPAPLRNQAIDRPVQPLHRRIELQVVGRGHKLREVEEQGGANRVLVQSDTDRLGWRADAEREAGSARCVCQAILSQRCAPCRCSSASPHCRTFIDMCKRHLPLERPWLLRPAGRRSGRPPGWSLRSNVGVGRGGVKAR